MQEHRDVKSGRYRKHSTLSGSTIMAITNVKHTKANKEKKINASTSFTVVDHTGSKDYTVAGNFVPTPDGQFLLPTL